MDKIAKIRNKEMKLTVLREKLNKEGIIYQLANALDVKVEDLNLALSIVKRIRNNPESIWGILNSLDELA